MGEGSSDDRHTPGPWRACTKTGQVQGFDNGGEYLRDVLASYHFTDEVREANARLIAAAPELLAALEEIEAWANLAHKAKLQGSATALLEGPVFERARAAIAKAKGES